MSKHTVIASGLGRVEAGQLTADPETVAHCEVCAQDVDLVVSVGPTHSCRDCLRTCLDAASIASYRLRSEAGGDNTQTPWGKVTG